SPLFGVFCFGRFRRLLLQGLLPLRVNPLSFIRSTRLFMPNGLGRLTDFDGVPGVCSLPAGEALTTGRDFTDGEAFSAACNLTDLEALTAFRLARFTVLNCRSTGTRRNGPRSLRWRPALHSSC